MKNKKKIGAITFHSSYNHGSVLQAYALQEFIKREFGKHFDYQIINLRTERQKKYYEKSYSLFDIKNNAKNILLAKYKPQILERQKKYELFIKNKLCLTDEYQDADSLAKANFNYDYYLSGSDQIWNYTILDFDWSFFLEFCGEKTKKISYAASFGPKPLELDELTKNRLKDDLSKYKNISVREIGSANMIEEITGENSAEIHIDPTLLLKK
ncbi:polysaccharide pyruvyl transferase family protein [Candidatus Saccharibacteria bacterium]|nr:polysaccharide pyruvyl transferase family protein [Candidatus Saccharibacteria bacterium]